MDRPGDRNSTVELMGLALDALDESAVLQHVLTAKEHRRGGRIITANVDCLRQIRADHELGRQVRKADLVVADGMPLIWASRLAGTPLPERVAGARLIWTLSQAAMDAGLSIFLLGGNPGVAVRAAESLKRRMPALRIAGTHCPPFGYENRPADLAAIHQTIDAARPDIVFCGLGFPKQERLMERLSTEYPETWFIACGASLAMAAGDVRRAPEWMQRAGLEWFFRLVQEPRRLFGRYVVRDMPFALRFFVWGLQTRILRSRRRLSSTSATSDRLNRVGASS